MSKIIKNKQIIITSGDESGIGPEIILKALASKEIPKETNILIIGSQDILWNTFKKLKEIGIKNIISPDDLFIQDPKIPEVSVNDQRINTGNSSFHYLRDGIEIAKSKPQASLVTGPICKKSWALAGHHYSGQTELLSEICNVSNVGMLFTAKSPYSNWRFNTLLATTHIPLAKVTKQITSDIIQNKLDLLVNFCKKFNKKITLKVAGINPHAGEEGLLGTEEKDIINATLNQWRIKNPSIHVEGPIPPDSCWISSAKAWKGEINGKHNGILAMYHDQGLIPVKIITLNYSVNTTLGIPFTRTSPDHGTGFDIAGKGLAQSQSMVEAIKTALDIT